MPFERANRALSSGGKSCTVNTFSDIVFIVDYIVNFYHHFLKFLVVLSPPIVSEWMSVCRSDVFICVNCFNLYIRPFYSCAIFSASWRFYFLFSRSLSLSPFDLVCLFVCSQIPFTDLLDRCRRLSLFLRMKNCLLCCFLQAASIIS